MAKIAEKQKTFLERQTGEAVTLSVFPSEIIFTKSIFIVQFLTLEGENITNIKHERPRLKDEEFSSKAVFLDVQTKLRALQNLSDAYQLNRFQYSIMSPSGLSEVQFNTEFIDDATDTTIQRRFANEKLNNTQKQKILEVINLLAAYAWDHGQAESNYLNLF